MEVIELVKGGVSNPRYCPVVEDISLDDDMPYEAVEQIEHK